MTPLDRWQTAVEKVRAVAAAGGLSLPPVIIEVAEPRRNGALAWCWGGSPPRLVADCRFAELAPDNVIIAAAAHEMAHAIQRSFQRIHGASFARACRLLDAACERGGLLLNALPMWPPGSSLDLWAGHLWKSAFMPRWTAPWPRSGRAVRTAYPELWQACGGRHRTAPTPPEHRPCTQRAALSMMPAVVAWGATLADERRRLPRRLRARARRQSERLGLPIAASRVASDAERLLAPDLEGLLR